MYMVNRSYTIIGARVSTQLRPHLASYVGLFWFLPNSFPNFPQCEKRKIVIERDYQSSMTDRCINNIFLFDCLLRMKTNLSNDKTFENFGT